jgi:hypothetical protein
MNAPGERGTTFDYAITPDTVPFSDGTAEPPRRSVVDLALHLHNPADHQVACPHITLRVPSGFGDSALTADPSTIEAAPGDLTPWSIGGGAGRWSAVPLPPVTGVGARETLTFVLRQVVVNSVPGQADIEIVENTDARRTETLSISKSRPIAARAAPVIHRFSARPDRVGPGDPVTLSWQVDYATRVALAPGPAHLPDPAGGAITVGVPRSTNFRLTAHGPGGQSQAEAMVTVMPVAVESFTASPSGAVAPGAEVRLSWTTRYAVSCAIDQGVGPVAVSGDWHVYPDQTTLYTLAAAGRDSQSASVLVPVAP